MEHFNAIKYLTEPRWQHSRPGLNRISKLLEMLGNPQQNLRFIHIAGTNGKGSTVAYISQIFIEAGYKTGQFTSPFLWDFCERVRINNKQISLESLTEISLKVKKMADTFPEDEHPTEFELLTAVAFLYYAKKNCDIVICEVGMGGRLDSTNVIEAKQLDAAVITPIAMDHVDFLGDTLEKIAFEKAGIIKKDCNVIVSAQKNEAMDSINKVAKSLNAKVYPLDENFLHIRKVDLSSVPTTRSFSYLEFQNLKTTLLASYQPKNAALAINVCNMVKHKYVNINDNSIIKGIENCRWPGRFDMVETSPYVIIDGGHNLDGAQALKKSLIDVFGEKKFIFIMGVLADKDYEGMVDVVCDIAKKVYCITPPNPRALSSDKLVKIFEKRSIEASVCNAENSLSAAKEYAKKDDVICAFGSLYLISSIAG